DARLNDISAEVSNRSMTPRGRVAFVDGKVKELEEFSDEDVWEFHKPTRTEDPKRILEAKWALQWSKNDDGTRGVAHNIEIGTSAGYATGGEQRMETLDSRRGCSIPSRAIPRAGALRKKYTDAADPMGIEPDALMKLIRPMRGQVGAPRRWWQRAVGDLEASGLKQRPLDPCLLVSYDTGGGSDGFILLHVGDVLEEAVKSKFKFWKWIEKGKMEPCGSDPHQTTHWNNKQANSTDLNIKVQTRACDLKPIAIDWGNGDNDRPFTLKGDPTNSKIILSAAVAKFP
ncbi:unnamed protein product, partial [Prorocentrum cordatum]